jgi:hypothetical protein
VIRWPFGTVWLRVDVACRAACGKERTRQWDYRGFCFRGLIDAPKHRRESNTEERGKRRALRLADVHAARPFCRAMQVPIRRGNIEVAADEEPAAAVG